MNRTHFLSVLIVILAGCSSSTTSQRPGNVYAVLDPSTGIAYNVPLRFDMSRGLYTVAGPVRTSAAPLDDYVAGRDSTGPRPEATAMVASVGPLISVPLQDPPERLAMIDAQRTAPPTQRVEAKVSEGTAISRMSPQPLNLKLDTEFESAKRLVRFAAATAVLGPGGKRAVTELVPWAKQAEKVHVRGGADSSGNPAHNRELAMARATAVSSAFVAAGVDRERISKSYCTDCFIASNETEAGRRLNRRVDVELLLKKEVFAQLPPPRHAPAVPDSTPLIRTTALR